MSTNEGDRQQGKKLSQRKKKENGKGRKSDAFDRKSLKDVRHRENVADARKKELTCCTSTEEVTSALVNGVTKTKMANNYVWASVRQAREEKNRKM